MTRHTVVWIPSAEDELGEIWLAAADQEAVARASNKIDSAFRDHADTAGETVAEGLRGYDCRPLRILYEILPQDRIVRILSVKRSN